MSHTNHAVTIHVKAAIYTIRVMHYLAAGINERTCYAYLTKMRAAARETVEDFQQNRLGMNGIFSTMRLSCHKEDFKEAESSPAAAVADEMMTLRTTMRKSEGNCSALNGT